VLDWEQYIAPMTFAYSTNYQRTIKKSSFEVTFGIKPRASHNPNPDLRLQYGEDLGTEMFQRLKICQELEKIRSYAEKVYQESLMHYQPISRFEKGRRICKINHRPKLLSYSKIRKINRLFSRGSLLIDEGLTDVCIRNIQMPK
jgi:hypothetical protein